MPVNCLTLENISFDKSLSKTGQSSCLNKVDKVFSRNFSLKRRHVLFLFLRGGRADFKACTILVPRLRTAVQAVPCFLSLWRGRNESERTDRKKAPVPCGCYLCNGNLCSVKKKAPARVRFWRQLNVRPS